MTTSVTSVTCPQCGHHYLPPPDEPTAQSGETDLPADPAKDEAYREAATDEYGDEGRIEIDADAKVSYGDDDGAYVAAWVWVDRDLTPLCKCGARNDDGEGFDGLCGSCADRAEAEGTFES